MPTPITVYCDYADLGRYGVNAEALERLSVEENQVGPIDAATAKVNSYLRAQYVLPLLRVGSDIKEATAIIAAWNILRVRGLKPGENPEDNVLRMAYEDTIRWLEKVAAGAAFPDVDDSDPGTPAAGDPAGAPIVTSNSQRGYFSEDAFRAGPFQGSRR